MNYSQKDLTILVAEDDPDDSQLLKEAFRENRSTHQLMFVENGEELINYLSHVGKFSDASTYPVPALILLDLNMPKKDGREALKEIKNNPEIKDIPIIVLTTSRSEEDITRCYDLGVNSFIIKPVSYSSLVSMVDILEKYWLQTVVLPLTTIQNKSN